MEIVECFNKRNPNPNRIKAMLPYVGKRVIVGEEKCVIDHIAYGSDTNEYFFRINDAIGGGYYANDFEILTERANGKSDIGYM